MDVMVLEKDGTNPSYLPTEYVEGFSSKIWTERYRYGDFEFHTPYIEDTLAKIPERALITINQSAEVMMVDSRDIAQADDGKTELVIKGRSLTEFTEHRHFDGQYQKKFKMTYNYVYTYCQAVDLLLWNSLVNGTGDDILRAGTTKTVLDKIPNALIAESVNRPGAAKNRWLTPGSVREPVDQFLSAGRLGIRTLRPASGPVWIVNVDHAGSNRGAINYVSTDPVTALVFQVYDGVDRTIDQTALTPVIFSQNSGDIERPDYLRATDKYKTFARVVSADGNKDIGRKAADKQFAGLDRRVIYVDGGSKEDGQSQSEFVADLVDLGQTTLADNDRTNLISADVSPINRYYYRAHYNLGDRVTLQGQYGINQDMYVTEVVRTEDLEGRERIVPGLTLPDDMDDSGTAD